MYAAEHGHAYALELLLQRYGANVRLRNPPITGANALYFAMRRVNDSLKRRYQRSFGASSRDLDPCLAILVGPLDPVQYQDRFGYAMFDIQRYARATYKP
jgi:hypothetical protein